MPYPPTITADLLFLGSVPKDLHTDCLPAVYAIAENHAHSSGSLSKDDAPFRRHQTHDLLRLSAESRDLCRLLHAPQRLFDEPTAYSLQSPRVSAHGWLAVRPVQPLPRRLRGRRRHLVYTPRPPTLAGRQRSPRLWLRDYCVFHLSYPAHCDGGVALPSSQATHGSALAMA